MKKCRIIQEADIRRFSEYLHQLEYAPGSVEKYLRELTAFSRWLAGRRLPSKGRSAPSAGPAGTWPS